MTNALYGILIGWGIVAGVVALFGFLYLIALFEEAAPRWLQWVVGAVALTAAFAIAGCIA